MGNTCLLFKNINQKIYKFLKENREFFLWVLILLSIDYLLLFSLEITLPGLVIENFNLNILLLIVLLGWFLILNYCDIKKNEFKDFNNFFIFIFFISLLLGGWLVLFNVVFWEFLVIFFILLSIAFAFVNKN
jgi:hypothetical protein